MNNPTFFEVQKWAFSCIKGNGGTLEDVDYLICGQMGWNKTQLLMNYRTRIDDKNYQELQEKIELYNQDYPLQYLIGYQDFYGLRLKVTKDTLIPRPETEELVGWILNDNSKNENYDVLDVGTGTGAIGLALKSIRSNWNIFLSDISEPALKVAKENAQNLNLDVSFSTSDLFEKIEGKKDIIVSNPPYISENEKIYMDKSVLNYEPHQALFAKNNGLEIYERIANESGKLLKQGSKIYMEIGFLQGKAVKKIFKDSFPNSEITLKKDINGNDRMICVKI